jgi:eukaryotic-like serine/threonine-protein kinase
VLWGIVPSVAERGDELIGRTLDGYKVEYRLGAGATGVVFRAKHPAHAQPVALKVLHDNLGTITSLKRRFEREARVLSKLEHPNIVHIMDFGVVDGLTYIAMELLEGLTLEDVLDEAPIDADRALDIAAEVLEGLAFAHALHVVHRDLKPANVFLCRGGRAGDRSKDRVKLLDFGLAKILSDDDVAEDGTLTRRGRIVGTPAYMAPEQITGVSLDVRADVYALGVLLYELLADRRPFLSERRSELLRAHLLEPPPPLGSVREGLTLDPQLESLVMRALEKDPGKRHADATELLAALRQLPTGAARLGPKAAASPLRSRSGATSEVISGSERRAVSESISDSSAPKPLIPLGTPTGRSSLGAPSTTALTASDPLTDPGGAPRSKEQAALPPAPAVALGIASMPPGPPSGRADPRAEEGDPGGVSTPVLYGIAATLFVIAGVLWWTIGVP